MKPFPWKCGVCRERAVSRDVLPVYETEMEHDGRKYSVAVLNFEVLRCALCGTIILDDPAEERLHETFLDKIGLLHPSAIRKERDALGLTQKQLDNTLEISESTLSRWETGTQIQQRCMDKILRAFFTLPALRKFWGVAESTWELPVNAVRAVPQKMVPINLTLSTNKGSWGESTVGETTVTSPSSDPGTDHPGRIAA